MTQLDPHEAPPGYIAVPSSPEEPSCCHGCAFDVSEDECSLKTNIVPCGPHSRKDKADVVFVKAKSAPADRTCKGCGEWMDPGATHMCKKTAPAEPDFASRIKELAAMVNFQRAETAEKERDTLKAECAKLRAQLDLWKGGHDISLPDMYERAKGERDAALSECAKLREEYGHLVTRYYEKERDISMSNRIMEEYMKRLEEAEAECAKLRERVDITDACRQELITAKQLAEQRAESAEARLEALTSDAALRAGVAIALDHWPSLRKTPFSDIAVRYIISAARQKVIEI